MGIVRVFIGFNSEFFGVLCDGGFLIRDVCMKEWKKYGFCGVCCGI